MGSMFNTSTVINASVAKYSTSDSTANERLLLYHRIPVFVATVSNTFFRAFRRFQKDSKDR